MPPQPQQCSSSRPVTVRSVKRRDRGKSLERRGAGGSGGGNVSVSVVNAGRPLVAEKKTEEEERAVMV